MFVSVLVGVSLVVEVAVCGSVAGSEKVTCRCCVCVSVPLTCQVANRLKVAS